MTIVNRKPSLVHGLEDAKVNRVACGSSHSIAWLLTDQPSIASQEPVAFPTVKDPLGEATLGFNQVKFSKTNFFFFFLISASNY